MESNLKNKIKHAFDAPEPKRRDAFLAAADFPRVGCAGFLFAQAGYIRKRVWAASVLIALAALAVMLWAPGNQMKNFMWLISSLLPLAALAGVSEIAKSTSHNMAEMESACKYSLSNIVPARLFMMGAANAMMLIAVSFFFKGVAGFGFLRTCVYIFLPFLLTSALSLFTINRVRHTDGIYICAVIAVLVSAGNAIGLVRFNAVFARGNGLLQTSEVLLLLASAIIVIIEGKKYSVKGALSWN